MSDICSSPNWGLATRLKKRYFCAAGRELVQLYNLQWRNSMIVPERHVANSRSQKKICVYDTDDLAYIHAQTDDHNSHDSFDGYCVFQFAIIRAIRLYGELSAERDIMERMSVFHRKRMNDDFFAAEMVALSLFTSVAVKNYGESLCQPFFRELT